VETFAYPNSRIGGPIPLWVQQAGYRPGLTAEGVQLYMMRILIPPARPCGGIGQSGNCDTFYSIRIKSAYGNEVMLILRWLNLLASLIFHKKSYVGLRIE
jgi:hypothetical protein